MNRLCLFFFCCWLYCCRNQRILFENSDSSESIKDYQMILGSTVVSSTSNVL